MNLTTAPPQRGLLGSFATIRTLTNIFVGSVALMFAMTATADILGITGTSPEGIALDADGNVYTANSGSNNVSKILAPVAPAATPVSTSPLWLLGMMAGLLSLVAVRKLRKA